MALSADKKAMLITHAASGDIYAIEALALEATGRGGLVNLGAIAAKAAANIMASQTGLVANPLPILAQPATPRNLRVTFGAAWDAGDVTIAGTNQFGAAVSETFVVSLGGVVVGTKIFKTVTSITKATTGTAGVGSTATVGTGDKLGCPFDVLDTMGMGLVQATPGAANTPEAVTMDPTYNAVTFTTVPDGTKVLCLLANV